MYTTLRRCLHSILILTALSGRKWHIEWTMSTAFGCVMFISARIKLVNIESNSNPIWWYWFRWMLKWTMGIVWTLYVHCTSIMNQCMGITSHFVEYHHCRGRRRRRRCAPHHYYYYFHCTPCDGREWRATKLSAEAAMAPSHNYLYARIDMPNHIYIVETTPHFYGQSNNLISICGHRYRHISGPGSTFPHCMRHTKWSPMVLTVYVYVCECGGDCLERERENLSDTSGVQFRFWQIANMCVGKNMKAVCTRTDFPRFCQFALSVFVTSFGGERPIRQHATIDQRTAAIHLIHIEPKPIGVSQIPLACRADGGLNLLHCLPWNESDVLHTNYTYDDDRWCWWCNAMTMQPRCRAVDSLSTEWVFCVPTPAGLCPRTFRLPPPIYNYVTRMFKVHWYRWYHGYVHRTYPTFMVVFGVADRWIDDGVFFFFFVFFFWFKG